MDEPNLAGMFVGNIGGEDGAANIDVKLDEQGVRWTVGPLGEVRGNASVESADPKVRHFQREVNRLVRRVATRYRPVTTNFKEPPSQRPMVPVPCPACHGVEPKVWDCETCDSAGVVPG